MSPESSPAPRRGLPAWSLGISATAFAVLVAAVARWGVDVPFWDQWVFVHHLRAWHDGELALGDLWRPHNEHRLLVPQLVMLGLARLSGWDIRWELWTNVVLALAAWLAFLLLARRALGRPPAWLVAVSSLSFFGLGQWQNWSWGWQIQIFACVLAVTLGLAVLAGDGRFRLASAVACGVAASFSFAAGLLFWPLALPLVVRGGRRRGGGKVFLAWLAVAAVVAGLYFGVLDSLDALDAAGGDAAEPAPRPSPASVAEPSAEPTVELSALLRIKLFAGYVAVYLGGALFAPSGRLALFGGPLLAVLAVALISAAWRRRLADGEEGVSARVLPFLVLAAHGVGAAALTAVGRLEMGIGQALSSRYVTLSQLFWLGLAGALVAVWPRREEDVSSDVSGGAPGFARAGSAVLARLALAVAVAGLLWSSVAGARAMGAESSSRAEVRRQILDGNVEDEALSRLFPNTAVARRGLQRLRRVEMGLYRPSLERRSEAGTPREGG